MIVAACDIALYQSSVLFCKIVSRGLITHRLVTKVLHLKTPWKNASWATNHHLTFLLCPDDSSFRVFVETNTEYYFGPNFEVFFFFL